MIHPVAIALTRTPWWPNSTARHAAGCSHYQGPTQGEKLNVTSVLASQPGDPHSKSDSLLHYDLKVSGFPSSHAGHLVFSD
jgi:hypothetical protein